MGIRGQQRRAIAEGAEIPTNAGYCEKCSAPRDWKEVLHNAKIEIDAARNDARMARYHAIQVQRNGVDEDDRDEVGALLRSLGVVQSILKKLITGTHDLQWVGDQPKLVEVELIETEPV